MVVNLQGHPFDGECPKQIAEEFYNLNGDDIMTLMKVDHAPVLALVEELNQTQLSTKFAPFLASPSGVCGDFYDDRKLITGPLGIPSIPALSNRAQLNDRVAIAATRLCCNALFASVEFRDGRRLTGLEDGIQIIDATRGFGPDIFPEIHSRFENAMTDTAVGISYDEHDALVNYAQMSPSQEIVMEHGKVTYVAGSRILRFPKKESAYLTEEHGVRTCFALVKGALFLRIHWEADFEHDKIIAHMSAVRTNGGQVLKVLTTV